MADTFISITQGSGTKLHTFDRTIGANTVHDEVMILGEPYLATYTVTTLATSIATLDSHVLQIMAGASLNVYVRSLRIYQAATATTAALVGYDLMRLTTAGTGGGAISVRALDDSDAAAGATAMTLPTVKGAEGARLQRFGSYAIQTVPAGGAGLLPFMASEDWDGLRTKSIRIAAGTSNGIAVKNVTAVAAATVYVVVGIVEANF